MKFVVVTMCTLFALSTSLFAADCAVKEGEVLLKKGETVEADVIAANPMTLVASFKSTETPKAEVTSEHVGFECEVLSVKERESGCFEVKVDWSPGADYSGCYVTVSGAEEAYEALLYMDYHAHN